jgi:hypothetical protein
MKERCIDSTGSNSKPLNQSSRILGLCELIDSRRRGFAPENKPLTP